MGVGGVRRIVIVGGGTAGWMAAAALSRAYASAGYSITLIESDEIGIVGVGEATIPPIQEFNAMLGLDENDFLKAVNGTIKLGIRFVNWKAEGSDYFHPFGVYGIDMGVNFNHHLMRYRKAGGNADFGLFNPQTVAARQNRFGRMQDINPKAPPVNYAFHFDASLYSKYLRAYSEKLGAVRREGKIVRVEQHPESGDVTGVVLENGTVVEGDLLIDCSGFRGLLIEQTLKSGYEDWSRWLPCDRAAAVPCDKVGPATPYTTATAREAGWQWRIPLQHRTGNGYVFCSEYMSEEEASAKLLGRLDGPTQAEPRILRFQTGHRRQMWNRNVVAMGLASGFLEPLESTSIWLVQQAIMTLLKYFPRDGITAVQRKCFNDDLLADYDNVKDFLIAHYKVTEREDTPFWAYCRNMDIPDSLAFRLDSFKAHNQPLVRDTELFKEASWFAVLVGQGMEPDSYHPLADIMPQDEFRWRMDRIREGTAGLAAAMPSHEAYVAKACPSPNLIHV
jgi:tryptophan 7-halogenase